MTELNLLVAFLVSLLDSEHNYPTLKLDVFFIQKVSDFLTSTKSSDYFESIISGLCKLDDAIVTGLSEGVFRFEHPAFSYYKQSTLPKFLYGLLSAVFNDYGLLKEQFDPSAVEICLLALRLVRRAKSKELAKKAEAKAVDTFFSYQDRVRPGDAGTLNDLSLLWQELEGDSFHDSVTLGKPGGGVTKDMRFPIVPDLCFPNVPKINQFPENVRYLLKKACDDQYTKAGFPNVDDSYVLPDCDFIGVYDHTDHSTAEIAIVPKKYNEGRAITITTMFATILNATMRKSILNRIREVGAKSIVNIDDQTQSHKVLEEHFHSVSCIDLEGGSSCLTTQNLDICLSKTEYLGDCWKAGRPTFVRFKDKVVPLKTLTMGDASSVALLSGTLFLALVLAYKRYWSINFDLHRVVKLMVDDGRFRVVGDDLIFPDYLIWEVRKVLRQLGVTINHRKSSRASSHHKESCGSWFITDNGRPSGIRRIYPFRAAVSDYPDNCSVTQVIEQYCEKVDKSTFAEYLYRAHINVLLSLDERVHYDSLKSYTPSIVGTRFGQQWSTIYRTSKQDQQFLVDDSLAYICGLRDGMVTPRYTRESHPSRLKHRKRSLDLTVIPSGRSYMLECVLWTFAPAIYLKLRPYHSAQVPLNPINVRWRNVIPSRIRRVGYSCQG